MDTRERLSVCAAQAVVRATLLLFCLLLTSCAPMPGNNLFPGLQHSTPLDAVGVEIIVDPAKTSVECNKLLWHSGNWYQAMFNCLFNACIVMACAQVHWNDDGEISQCKVFLSFDSAYMLKHELKHCEGYEDMY